MVPRPAKQDGEPQPEVRAAAAGTSYQPLEVAQLANVPKELQEGKRFVCWREEIRDGKPTKVPVDPHTGYEAKSNNSATWVTLAEAIAHYRMHSSEVHGGRSRRPPLDRMNALLSFLYSMLMNDCRTALESVGLDPQLGFLHTVRPGRAALALDLMEEFRSILADRLALTLVNRKQLQGDDFEVRPGGAVQMRESARKSLILAYQERKQELTSHPLLDQKLAIGLLPQIQARLLARTIRGETEGYLPYLER